jgi:hypothetical protein
MGMKMTKLLATLVASLFVAGAAYANDAKTTAATPAVAQAKDKATGAVKAVPAKVEAKVAAPVAAKAAGAKDAVKAAVPAAPSAPTAVTK